MTPSLGALLSFAVMSVIWGLTWIAIKFGVAAIPPFTFAGARLFAAGAVLLALARARGSALPADASRSRILIAGILVNTVSYGLVFWGMQFVPSGLASVVNLALIPVGLFSMGLIAGEETFSARKMLAIVIGVAGLVILFLPSLSFDADRRSLAGMLALVSGTLTYCCGSILSRPLLRVSSPVPLAGWLTIIGGTGLIVLALAFEPIDRSVLSAFLDPTVFASWAFLVLGGSVVAFTLYLRLLRDWGPTRAGMYAFVSPIIAVLLGVVVMHEPFGVYELAGSSFMLGAAGLAMSRRSS